MKDIFEKIGLSEFFAHICPGVILFSSFALWIEPQKIAAFLGKPIPGQEFLAVVFILIFCYTFGLIVASWSSRGADLYIRKKRRLQAFKNIKNRKGKILKGVLWVIHGLPEPRSHPSLVETKLRIAEDLQKYSGLQGLSLFETAWDWLVLYRTIMTDRVSDRGRFILTEADSIHRRFLFCQGVALAFLLVAVQTLIRFVLLSVPLNNPFTSNNHFWLVVITSLGAFASFCLRNVAGRLWEHELILTTSLTQL
jgi:hypothetical protein